MLEPIPRLDAELVVPRVDGVDWASADGSAESRAPEMTAMRVAVRMADLPRGETRDTPLLSRQAAGPASRFFAVFGRIRREPGKKTVPKVVSPDRLNDRLDLGLIPDGVFQLQREGDHPLLAGERAADLMQRRLRSRVFALLKHEFHLLTAERE